MGLVGYRNRADAVRNDSYVVFLLRAVGGTLITGTTEEIMAAGFYSVEEMARIPRLAPLSRVLAEAAILDKLNILHASRVPSLLANVSPMTLFMG